MEWWADWFKDCEEGRTCKQTTGYNPLCINTLDMIDTVLRIVAWRCHWRGEQSTHLMKHLMIHLMTHHCLQTDQKVTTSDRDHQNGDGTEKDINFNHTYYSGFIFLNDILVTTKLSMLIQWPQLEWLLTGRRVWTQEWTEWRKEGKVSQMITAMTLTPNESYLSLRIEWVVSDPPPIEFPYRNDTRCCTS